MRITEIDVRDETALREWWEVGRAASRERALQAWPAWEVSRRALPLQRTDSVLTLLTAHEGDVAVGSALLLTMLLDNTHLAEIDVYVEPTRRRRGVGRALLADVEGRARAAGRSTAITSVFAPLEADSPGLGFGLGAGYEVASAEETKTVDLIESRSRWPELQAEVERARGDYELLVFSKHCPDEYIEGYCALLSGFTTSIPTGLDLREAAWNPERLRESEEQRASVGMTPVVALAIAPDGQVAGFSDVRINEFDPTHAAVGGTMVRPVDRGHRLGLGMKLLTHGFLLEHYPECAWVETGNAEVNAPMNAVNERMGYRVVERCLDLQKQLTPIRES